MSELMPCPVLLDDTIDCTPPHEILEILARNIRAACITCPNRRPVSLEKLAEAFREKFFAISEYNGCRMYDFIRNYKDQE